MVFGFQLPNSKIDNYDIVVTRQLSYEIPRTDFSTRHNNNETIYIDHGLPIIRPTLETLIMDTVVVLEQNALIPSSFEMNQPEQQGISLVANRFNNALLLAGDGNDENNANEMLVPHVFMLDLQPREGRLISNDLLMEIIDDVLDISALDDDDIFFQQQ